MHEGKYLVGWWITVEDNNGVGSPGSSEVLSSLVDSSGDRDVNIGPVRLEDLSINVNHKEGRVMGGRRLNKANGIRYKGCRSLVIGWLGILLLWLGGNAYAGTPQNIRNTNINDVTFTVSWITDTAEVGQINYGTAPDNLSNIAYDDRGESTSDDTHYVTIYPSGGLALKTTYYFDIVSGGVTYDNGGNHYTCTTGPTLTPASPGGLVYGKVYKNDGTTFAEGTIVYITVEDNNGVGSSGSSEVLSSLVNSSGVWDVSINTVRVEDLSAYFNYSSSGDNVKVSAQGAGDGAASQTVDTDNDKPAPDMTLGLGAISGQISYGGTQTGKLYIGVFDNPQFNGEPVYSTTIANPSFPQDYTVTPIPDGTYYVGAYIDSTGDEQIGREEPQGEYGVPDPVTVAGGGKTPNINFTLVDPQDDDTEGPVIRTPVYLSSVISGQSIDISANISDATTGNSGINKAILYYGYSSPYNQNNVVGTGPGGNGDGNWTFTIPAQVESHEGETLKFYVWAEDNDNDIPNDRSSSINNNGGSSFSVSIEDNDTTPPAFSNPQVNPASPVDTNTLTFSLDIADPSGIKDNDANNASVYVMWATDANFTENVGTSDMNGVTPWASATPAGPFRPGTVYWKVYAEDNDNSPAGGWSSVYQVNITDDDTTPPTVGALQFSPSKPQVTDSIQVTVSVNDASGIWDDGSHPTLYYSWTSGIDPDNPGTYEGTADMNVSEGVATGTIPVPGAGGERTRYVKVRVWDNDFDNNNPNDRLSTDSAGSFTYADDDTQGPVIDTLDYPSGISYKKPISVTANISDSTTGNSGVYSATLYYGYTAPYNQNSIPGTGPGGNGDGIWSFPIPTQGGNAGQTLKFWIKAYDNDFDNGNANDRSSTIDKNSGSYYSIDITDTSSPYTSDSDYLPTKDATGIPIDTLISLHLRDDGTGVDGNSIVMKVNGNEVTPRINASDRHDVIFAYVPPVNFNYEQTVDVTIGAQDRATPPNVMSGFLLFHHAIEKFWPGCEGERCLRHPGRIGFSL